MSEIPPPCITCSHPRVVHNSADGPETFCRVTRCGCLGYIPPEQEPEPDPDPRRLVIEIPEGFAITVQLVPIDEPMPIEWPEGFSIGRQLFRPEVEGPASPGPSAEDLRFGPLSEHEGATP